MNESERVVAEVLEAQGWTVLRNGWPDFLIERDGEVRFVEVKTPGGNSLSADQKEMQSALRRAGIQGDNLMVQKNWRIGPLEATDEDVKRAMRGPDTLDKV